MKKAFKYYSVAFVILLILFNVIAFVSVGWAGEEKYTASFWIGYVFITLSFIGQFICTYFALRENEAQKTFYRISLIKTSYTGLILSFLFGGLCMLISPLPYWVGIIICAVILTFNVTAVAKASAAVEIVEAIDEKVKSKTSFIRSLTADAETLMLSAESESVKIECKKVYEAVRYSDPMSNEALAHEEEQIKAKYIEFSKAVKDNDIEMTREVAKQFVSLIEMRNKKCKLLK